MAYVVRFVESLSQVLRPHLGEVAMALVATLLVVYGNEINAAVKRRVIAWPFVVRLAVFVLLCAVGYGAIIIFVSPLVAKGLARLGGVWLAPLVAAAFLVVGILAERKRQV
ncbi:MAG: DUF3392 domain-containing protein [Planctomycetota bacterium]